MLLHGAGGQGRGGKNFDFFPLFCYCYFVVFARAVKEGDNMESTMFYLGMGTIIVCVLALSPALLLYVKTKKILHLYICLLLANYLIELVELLYIARFCLPEDIRYFNLIHFPVLRIFTTVSTLLLDLLILLRIMNLKFHKSCLLLFAAVALFCAYTAWLPQTLLTIWLFYMPRQICHFGYGIFFLIRRGLEKDEAVRKRMERCSFLVLGVFLLSVSILLEDSLLISHIQTYFTDMLSVTERNFSENILWLFIILCSMVYCVWELEQGGTSAAVSGPVPTPGDMGVSGVAPAPGGMRVSDSMPAPGAAGISASVPISGAIGRSGPGRTSGLMPAAAGAEQNSGIGMASEAARFGYLAAVSEEYKFTPREIQILDCILQYKTTAEICEELNISTGTVKTHTHNIYMKVNVKSRQELIRALTKTR